MDKYIRRHEMLIENMLQDGVERDWPEIAAYHKNVVLFMEHERLVHMLVALFFGIFLFMTVFLVLYFKEPVFGVLLIVLSIFEVFYLRYLYRLETGVQRMYKLYDKIYERMKIIDQQ